MTRRELWLVDSGQDEWERDVVAAFKTKALAMTVAELLGERAFAVPYYDTVPPYYEWLDLMADIREDGTVEMADEKTTSRFLGSPKPFINDPIVSVQRRDNRLAILVHVFGWDHDRVREVFAETLAGALSNRRGIINAYIVKRAAEFFERPSQYADWFDVEIVNRSRAIAEAKS